MIKIDKFSSLESVLFDNFCEKSFQQNYSIHEKYAETAEVKLGHFTFKNFILKIERIQDSYMYVFLMMQADNRDINIYVHKKFKS